MMQRSEVQRADEVCCTLLRCRARIPFMKASWKAVRGAAGGNSLWKPVFKRSVMFSLVGSALWLNSCDLSLRRTYWRSLIPAGLVLSAGFTLLLAVDGSALASVHKGQPLSKRWSLWWATVTPPEMTEPRKSNFTSKQSRYWQQQPRPRAWLSRQRNAKCIDNLLSQLRRASLSLWLGFLSTWGALRSHINRCFNTACQPCNMIVSIPSPRCCLSDCAAFMCGTGEHRLYSH